LRPIRPKPLIPTLMGMLPPESKFPDQSPRQSRADWLDGFSLAKRNRNATVRARRCQTRPASA
jgi:hypothetical protein